MSKKKTQKQSEREGLEIIKQQINESFQSGVIDDSLLTDHNKEQIDNNIKDK